MGIEIERKYLVRNTDYKHMSKGKTDICQGYLTRRLEGTVRVRVKGDRAYLTVKGKTVGDTREEFEYEVPVSDALSMLKMCEGSVISKTRYYVDYEGMCWEIDEFHGANEGLVLAEIELTASEQGYSLPPFVGEDVTGNPMYYNSNLK